MSFMKNNVDYSSYGIEPFRGIRPPKGIGVLLILPGERNQRIIRLVETLYVVAPACSTSMPEEMGLWIWTETRRRRVLLYWGASVLQLAAPGLLKPSGSYVADVSNVLRRFFFYPFSFIFFFNYGNPQIIIEKSFILFGVIVDNISL